jgi:UDP-N-acetylmuramate dehydrogenase
MFQRTDRYIVLDVTFELTPERHGRALRYPELAAALGEQVGGRAPLVDVRQAVLGLRSRKGMVLDPDDADTASAGSFFTNPVLTAEQIDRLVTLTGTVPPQFPQPDGKVKVPAAWLIERAGFGKGYGGERTRISTKHSLALTNRGGARAADLMGLAREIRAGVQAAFGVELVNEPVLVGLRW